jgi:glycine cleavage system aminomethyltransferase T
MVTSGFVAFLMSICDRRYTATQYALLTALMAAGKAQGIRNAGYRAIESLRLEKGYRAWGADITPDSSPLEAGLGFAVKLGKDIDFLGHLGLLYIMPYL